MYTWESKKLDWPEIELVSGILKLPEIDEASVVTKT